MLELLILTGLGVWLVLALRFCLRKGKKGGCCGDCAGCAGCGRPHEEEREAQNKAF